MIVDLSEIIGVEIPLSPNLSQDEINDLLEKEEVAYLAKDCFLRGRIDLETFLDILESCEIEMDEYLDGVLTNIAVATKDYGAHPSIII